MKRVSCASIQLDGSLLKRGFWLYVIEIHAPSRVVHYVGRTGDSSSPHASSVFVRLARHLDLSSHAKGNTLARQLRKIHVEPGDCSFEMVAVGPLFGEHATMESHRPVRDVVAGLEKALAVELGRRGYEVIGTHGAASDADQTLFRPILDALDARFPNRG